MAQRKCSFDAYLKCAGAGPVALTHSLNHRPAIACSCFRISLLLRSSGGLRSLATHAQFSTAGRHHAGTDGQGLADGRPSIRNARASVARAAIGRFRSTTAERTSAAATAVRRDGVSSPTAHASATAITGLTKA